MIQQICILLIAIYSGEFIINKYQNLLMFITTIRDNYNFFCQLYYEHVCHENYDDNIAASHNHPKVEFKYEDKYLKEIRSLNKKWIFSNEENSTLQIKSDCYFNEYITYKTDRIEQINAEIINLNTELNQLNIDKKEYYINESSIDTNSSINKNINLVLSNITVLENELRQLKSDLNSNDILNNLRELANDQASKFIIDEKISKLKNCYIIENTPVGNVIMLYDIDRSLFKYYSDNNIPYRYLEVVCRKFVKSFNCRPLYIDMDEELLLIEEKWNKKQKEIDAVKNDKKLLISNETPVKKSAFAKFKSYNKNTSINTSMAAPSKNNIPLSNIKETEVKFVKEQANVYSRDGKFANFNFLQKIENKIFDKKLRMSFLDFKKMKSNK